MLHEVPPVKFGQDLLFHKAQPLTELNALNQARRLRVFPIVRKISDTIRLKDGRTLGPGFSNPRGLSGLSASPRLTYKQKSTPYLSRGKRGLRGIDDFFSGIKNTVTGTVGAITGTISGVANAAQPIEKLLQENPSLLSLVKSYVPTAQAPTQPTVVVASQPNMPLSAGSTFGVSNKVWLLGAVGAGGLALVKALRR